MDGTGAPRATHSALIPDAFSGLQAEDSFGNHQLSQWMRTRGTACLMGGVAVGREVMTNGGVIGDISKGFFSKKRQQKESWKMMTSLEKLANNQESPGILCCLCELFQSL